MNIIVVYVFPTHPAYFEGACRFLMSYNKFPSGADHRLLVVSNGGPPNPEMRALIDLFDHPVEIMEHDNSGYDIGAEQTAAHNYPCDMMVFFGSTAYLRGPNWLARMAQAFGAHGPSALYGCMGNNGDERVKVSPHIRTTGYWLAPMLMNIYPMRVTQPHQRYAFEHGPACLTQWFRNNGRKAFMVTWHGEFEWPTWNRIHNGFHNGDQSELISGDKVSMPPFYPHA